MKTEESKEQWYDKDWLITLIFIVALSVVGIGIFITINEYQETLSWSERGQRGDFWGGHIGAFANFAAFLILVAATLMQRKELKLQRIELAESREINKEISNQNEKQAQTMMAQLLATEKERQVNFFIRLLENTKDTENKLSYESTSGPRGDKVVKRVEARHAFQNVLYEVSARSDQPTTLLREADFYQFFKALEICLKAIDSITDSSIKKSCEDLFLTNYSNIFLRDSIIIIEGTTLGDLENFRDLCEKVFPKTAFSAEKTLS